MKDRPKFAIGVGKNEKGQFVKGNQGGPGKPKGFSIVAHLKEQLQEIDEKEKKTHASIITNKYIQMAKDGDQVILKDLINRTDGLPKGALTEDGQIIFNVKL